MKNYFGINKLFVADVVHMTCKQQTTAREDLETVVAKLLHTDFSDSITNSADSSAQFHNKKQSEVYSHTRWAHSLSSRQTDRQCTDTWEHILCIITWAIVPHEHTSYMREIKHCTWSFGRKTWWRDQDMHVIMMLTMDDDNIDGLSLCICVIWLYILVQLYIIIMLFD